MSSAHVFFSVTAWAVLLAASGLSLLASAEHLALKRSVLLGLWQRLPPLPVLERGVFRMLYLAFAMLSGAILAMLPSFAAWWSPEQQIKTTFALAAWLSLAALLAGHWMRGWRSGTATGWALLGALLMGLAYASSSLGSDAV